MDDSLVVQKATQACPDLYITMNKYERWHWDYRCYTTRSSETLPEEGFDSALDTLCDFVQWQCNGLPY